MLIQGMFISCNKKMTGTHYSLFSHGGLSAVIKLVKLFAESVNTIIFLHFRGFEHIWSGSVCHPPRRSAAWRQESEWFYHGSYQLLKIHSVDIWRAKSLYLPRLIFLDLSLPDFSSI